MNEGVNNEIQLGLQNLEVNWKSMMEKINNFNAIVENNNSHKDTLKKMANEASSILSDLDETEKLIDACLLRFDN